MERRLEYSTNRKQIMALPTLVSGFTKKRDQILAIDLGTRTTKAVCIQRRGDSFVLARYGLFDAPIFEKTISPEVLAEHLKTVSKVIEPKSRAVSLTTNVNDAMVRHIEIPRMPLDDMRLVLKHNSRNYLQQDLLNYVFDCHLLPDSAGEISTKPNTGVPKQKVLVAGGKSQFINELADAIKSASLTASQIIPGIICPANAFEVAMPATFTEEVVALIDIGFKSSSICILKHGELVLSRVVNIGGDRLTQAVSESMGISYAEAEGIKVGMAGEVQAALESVVTPLGRELRASIDFFEHQFDRPVACAYLSGGSTRSESVVQGLQQELMIEAKTWNPTNNLKLELPPQQAGELEQIAPQLSVAIGAGIAAL
jgi:type IV pilus assembly protein PilM